jgi:hypothetical protein
MSQPFRCPSADPAGRSGTLPRAGGTGKRPNALSVRVAPSCSIDSRRARVPPVWGGQLRPSTLLPGVRDAARTGGCRPRGPQDRHRPVLRRRRINLARRAPRPRVAPPDDGPVLRFDAGGARTPWRHGREVHRRRDHGGVRHPSPPRGRRFPSGPGGHRDAGTSLEAERRCPRGARGRDRGANGDPHRRGSGRRPEPGARRS